MQHVLAYTFGFKSLQHSSIFLDLNVIISA